MKDLFSRLRASLAKKAEPLPPEALMGTRVHVTTDIKGKLGDAVSKMLMDEIDQHFDRPEVRARMREKFNELAYRAAGRKA